MSLVSPRLHIPQQMGSTFALSLVSLALHNSLLLGVNLQLALRTIRSLVSVLTRNRPWVTGEGQLAPKSFALPSYRVCLCLSTVCSADSRSPTFSTSIANQSLLARSQLQMLGDLLSVERFLIDKRPTRLQRTQLLLWIHALVQARGTMTAY